MKILGHYWAGASLDASRRATAVAAPVGELANEHESRYCRVLVRGE